MVKAVIIKSKYCTVHVPYKFHEIPSIAYQVMTEDGKIIQI